MDQSTEQKKQAILDDLTKQKGGMTMEKHNYIDEIIKGVMDALVEVRIIISNSKKEEDWLETIKLEIFRDVLYFFPKHIKESKNQKIPIQINYAWGWKKLEKMSVGEISISPWTVIHSAMLATISKFTKEENQGIKCFEKLFWSYTKSSFLCQLYKEFKEDTRNFRNRKTWDFEIMLNGQLLRGSIVAKYPYNGDGQKNSYQVVGSLELNYKFMNDGVRYNLMNESEESQKKFWKLLLSNFTAVYPPQRPRLMKEQEEHLTEILKKVVDNREIDFEMGEEYMEYLTTWSPVEVV